MFYSDDPLDKWWVALMRANASIDSVSETTVTAFPGRLALFVGAGISYDAPTCLPLGGELTEALVHHLLSERAAKEVLSAFAQCEDVTHRRFPRLEHVLETAFVRPAGDRAVEADPRGLLRLFQDRPYNEMHRVIARHLMDKSGWVVTTNFDDCIERAFEDEFGDVLPVHIISHEGVIVDPSGRRQETNWGLVKLHGTIAPGQGTTGLGAALSDLVPALPVSFRDLMTRIVEEVDLLVVAGYSGSDYFDVNAWVRNRINAKVSPRLIWVNHTVAGAQASRTDRNCEPYQSWQTGFGPLQILHGPSLGIVAGLLGQVPSISNDGMPAGRPELPALLKSLYAPGEAERHRIGARLAAAIGLGELADEEFDSHWDHLDDDNADWALLPIIDERRGHLNRARAGWSWWGALTGKCVVTQRARLFRIEQKPWKALGCMLVGVCSGNRSRTANELLDFRIEAAEALLDIAEGLQRLAPMRKRYVCRFFGWAMQRFWAPIFDGPPPNEISIALDARVQLVRMREVALFEDLDGYFFSSFLDTVDREVSHPDVDLGSGPVVEGFYLNALSCCREEDRLADLLATNLIFVRMLTAVQKRRWPDGPPLRKVRQLSDDAYIRKIVDFLEDADLIARALCEPHLTVVVARERVRSDKIIGGFHNWRQQRLWTVPHRPHRRLPRP